MSKPHVLIVNHPSFYNLGNASLLYSTIDLIDEAITPESITVWCLHPQDTGWDFGATRPITLVPSLARVTGGKLELLGMLADMALTFAWACLDRVFGRFPSFSRVTRELARADLVVVQGGDNLADSYGIKPLVACLYNILVALVAGKATVLLSHTVGPFKSNLWKRITMRILAKTGGIIVRDEYSVGLLRKAGLENHLPIVLLPDVAFLLPVQTRSLPFPAHSRDDDVLRVGIVPSSIVYKYISDGAAAKDKHNWYVGVMVETVEYLIQSHNAQVVLIPHVQEPMHNDLFVAEQIYASVSNKSKVTILRNELDPQKVKFVISKLDFLLTARMHPSIHSLSVGVPVIGIDYNAKMKSLLNMFELDYLCVDLPQLNQQNLVETIDSLIGELSAAKQKVAANRTRLVRREDYLDQIRIFWATAQKGES